MQNGHRVAATMAAATMSGTLQDELRKCWEDIQDAHASGRLTGSQLSQLCEHYQRAQGYASQANALGWSELYRLRQLLDQLYPPGADQLPQATLQRLYQEVAGAWTSVRQAQEESPCPNITRVAKWLRLAEEALRATPPSPEVSSYVLHVYQALAKAREGARWHRWSYLAIGIQLLYLFAVPMGLWMASLQLSPWMNMKKDVLASTLFHTPFEVFVWGFLGGVCWCLYFACYWVKRRLFDCDYLAWYIAHPWLSAVLGGIISLLVGGGLASLSGQAASPSEARAVILVVMSFVAGFSTNRIWKFLDHTLCKLLGSDDKQDPLERGLRNLPPSRRPER